MSRVYLPQLNVRRKWAAATPRINSYYTKTKMGEHGTYQKPPGDLFPARTGETYLYSESGGLAEGAKEIKLLMWLLLGDKFMSQICLHQERMHFLSLCLLCNYIRTFLYRVGADFTGCTSLLTHRGPKHDMNPLNTAQWPDMEHLCVSTCCITIIHVNPGQGLCFILFSAFPWQLNLDIFFTMFMSVSINLLCFYHSLKPLHCRSAHHRRVC